SGERSGTWPRPHRRRMSACPRFSSGTPRSRQRRLGHSEGLRLLVIGGTRFLGRAIVDAALGHGHEVTLFNRGKTNPHLYPGLHTILGDRVHDAGVLRGRDFDVAIDVAGTHPAEVGPLVEILRGSVEHYVFVSTISVYADHSIPQVEGQAVLSVREDQSPGEAYGAAKAASDRLVISAFGQCALVVR